jgi:hypothetical protein
VIELHRVFENVEPTGFCWLWTGGMNNCGYGQVTFRGRTHSAHRVVWELLIGPIAKGLQLDHLCHVRSCVNPDHLEPVTKSENMRRAGIRNGWIKGVKPTRKPKEEHKVRSNVATATHCKHGHDLAAVGIYETMVKSRQQTVRLCLACKKRVQCKANHKKSGCTPQCELQTYPRV